MQRYITQLTLACLVALAACKGKPTIGELKSKHGEAAKTLTKGTRAAFKAILSSPRQEVGAKCERPGLTRALGKGYNKPAAAGNTEIVTLRGEYGSAPGEEPDFNFSGDGPVGLWASRLQTDDDTLLSEDWEADFLTTANTKQLIVHYEPNPQTHYDMFLVDLPAGTIACGFGVEAPPRPEYDLETGADFPSGDFKQELDRVNEELTRQLHARFGIGEAPSGTDKADTEMRAWYAKLADALATPEFPECKDADPAGAVRTTVKRLNAYAGRPALAKNDEDRLMEPAGVISQAFLDLVDRTKRDQRGATFAALKSAPATIVIDMVASRTALLSGDNQFQAGFARARAVRFDPTGAAVCQRVVEVQNPDELNVRSRGGNVMVGLYEASKADLLAQLVKAFKAP